MNSLDTRAATAEDGVGIVRVPSWQAEAWPARHLVRRLADDEPAAMPLHLMFQPKIRAAAGYLVEAPRADPFGARPLLRTIKGIIIQFFNRARSRWYTKTPINRVS